MRADTKHILGLALTIIFLLSGIMICYHKRSVAKENSSEVKLSTSEAEQPIIGNVDNSALTSSIKKKLQRLLSQTKDDDHDQYIETHHPQSVAKLNIQELLDFDRSLEENNQRLAALQMLFGKALLRQIRQNVSAVMQKLLNTLKNPWVDSIHNLL